MPDDTISAEQRAEWEAFKVLQFAFIALSHAVVTQTGYDTAVAAYESAMTDFLVALDANGRSMPG